MNFSLLSRRDFGWPISYLKKLSIINEKIHKVYLKVHKYMYYPVCKLKFIFHKKVTTNSYKSWSVLLPEKNDQNSFRSSLKWRSSTKQSKTDVCVAHHSWRQTLKFWTKNDTDLKFGKHTPIDLIWKNFFCFFEKISLTDASLEKLPCHVDFTHISSIAL